MTPSRDNAADATEDLAANDGVEGDAAAARRSAMDFLARREHAAAELERKLRRRYAPQVIQAVISRLAEEGLQSDSRFAESYVRQRAERGHGPLRIRRELQERGVDESQAGSALATSEIDWCEVAARALFKKFGALEEPLPLVDRARVLRFAAYRGFSREHLPRTLD